MTVWFVVGVLESVPSRGSTEERLDFFISAEGLICVPDWLVLAVMPVLCDDERLGRCLGLSSSLIEGVGFQPAHIPAQTMQISS